ncbi:DNA recombination protein RmuC [Aeromicrobium phragmitis]|uniref:DNA recombination protein RmuC n=1 Tax=Aeromicrobium phragmitis TaxID=2478914 RepID=A0A3L8PKB3_9ACTN|nr:DNA recombination protein RmuC [Aeromicrobium phragmitis]RLV55751.1 DNA recombination protein RmuC [Aeromicrobium phragmitis]
MDALTLLLVAVLALLAGFALGHVAGARRRPAATAQEFDAAHRAVEPVAASLDRFDARLRDLESQRVAWQAQLREQVESVRLTSDQLRRETASLASALRRPQVRGRWGELHLKRTAELAGMLEHCDFDLQVSTRHDDTVLRPDMVVRLAGGKSVVVDAKVPLDAYLDVAQAEDDDEAAAHLRRHTRQLRTHVDQLAAKTYWRQFDSAPEFVVLFVPGESFLSAALETDPALLEYAAAKQVVLATPTTLIALLRTVAFAWTQEKLAENAREIHRAARELYERIGTVSGHVDRLGAALERAVGAYNDTVASVESRVLVSARRLQDLQVSDQPLEMPRLVDTTPRAMTAPELTDRLTS